MRENGGGAGKKPSFRSTKAVFPSFIRNLGGGAFEIGPASSAGRRRGCGKTAVGAGKRRRVREKSRLSVVHTEYRRQCHYIRSTIA